MADSSVSLFQVSAALWVVRAIDADGSDQAALESAFQRAITQGRFPRPDLDNAHALLVERGLVLIADGRARHNESIGALLSLPDPTALPLLARLLATSELDDPLRRAAIGSLGEQAVERWCVDELVALGHHDFAAQVRRVSLVSDRFGYDIAAPSIQAEDRMLEVKTTTSPSTKTFRFFLTRNEYDVGRSHQRQWAMVACVAVEDAATVIGWCRAAELERYIPDDANGRWTEAQVSLPSSALLGGVPSAVS